MPLAQAHKYPHTFSGKNYLSIHRRTCPLETYYRLALQPESNQPTISLSLFFFNVGRFHSEARNNSANYRVRVRPLAWVSLLPRQDPDTSLTRKQGRAQGNVYPSATSWPSISISTVKRQILYTALVYNSLSEFSTLNLIIINQYCGNGVANITSLSTTSPQINTDPVPAQVVKPYIKCLT